MTVVVTGEALVDLLIGHDGDVTAALGGGPFNTARTMARLGVPASFAGVLSCDRFGELLLATLRTDGVDESLVQRTELPTTLAAAELDEHGAATYRFYVSGTSAPSLASFVFPPNTTAVHAGTLGLVLEPMASVTEELLFGLAADVLLMVDINCRPKVVADRRAYLDRISRVAARADVVKVSGDDLDYLADATAGERAEDALQALLDAGVQVVLHTDGGRAVHVRTSTDDVELAVPVVQVADTIGAGDAFGGGFLAGWTRHGRGRAEVADLDAVVAAACEAVLVAAVTCARVGANPPHAADLGGIWIS